LVANELRCAAVIPCFNEATTISSVVEGALRKVGAVWVVDDGSSDGTKLQAKGAGAHVIWHDVNLGKGAAVRDGLTVARAAGFEFAVILDGDGQHDPADIPKLLEAARAGGDLVIGNRMGACEAMDGTRRFVNRWMSARMEQRFGVVCPDSQCGFRCVRLEAWAKMQFRENRFEVESEMIASFARAGMKIAFVPVACLRARRPSRIHPIVDTVRWFRWWLTTK
jgi:glycosyltransferase involved in cell wall biosynthesis